MAQPAGTLPVRSGCFPTRTQELLLKAALLPGAEGRSAWQAWRRDLDLVSLDGGSQRLLPLLVHNLAALGIDDPLMPIFRGVQRRTWVNTQLLLEATAPVLGALQAAAIPTMLLKGAALATRFYRDLSLRPMVDFDVLVPKQQAEAAIDALVAAGFQPEGGRTAGLVKQFVVPTSHAWSFRDRDDGRCDLHWHALHLACQPGADDGFWARAVPTRLRGTPTLLLDDTDQLLHVVVHGMSWGPVPPLRWVADAATILRATGGALDWDRLVAQAHARGATLRMREALGYVRDLLRAPVPREVLASLHRTRVPPLERLEHHATTRPPEQRSQAQRLALRYRQAQRRATPLGKRLGLAGHVRLLQELLHLERAWQLPLWPMLSTMRSRWRFRAMVRRWAPGALDAAGLAPVAAPPAMARTIAFSPSGDGVAVQRAGWSVAELPDGTWSNAGEAWLALPIHAEVGSDLLLTVVLQAFISPHHPRIAVGIVVNDHPLDRWLFRYGHEGVETCRVAIPAAVAARRDPLEVVFVIDSPASPHSLGHSYDPRRLGIYLRSVRLDFHDDQARVRETAVAIG